MTPVTRMPALRNLAAKASAAVRAGSDAARQRSSLPESIISGLIRGVNDFQPAGQFRAYVLPEKRDVS